MQGALVRDTESCTFEITDSTSTASRCQTTSMTIVSDLPLTCHLRSIVLVGVFMCPHPEVDRRTSVSVSVVSVVRSANSTSLRLLFVVCRVLCRRVDCPLWSYGKIPDLCLFMLGVPIFTLVLHRCSPRVLVRCLLL